MLRELDAELASAAGRAGTSLVWTAADRELLTQHHRNGWHGRECAQSWHVALRRSKAVSAYNHLTELDLR